MKVFVIGNGGREHALVHTFHRQGHKVYCLPGNGGTETLSEPVAPEWKRIHLGQADKFLEFAKQYAVDLTVVGPESLLAMGIVDRFNSADLPIFGPTRMASQLESSKAFSKKFMKKHGVPTAKFSVCKTTQEALNAAHQFHRYGSRIVIKPDGLTAGKGVIPCNSLDEAVAGIDLIMEAGKFGRAGNTVVVEERLYGPEVSILAFSDGQRMIPMISAQDHKRLLEGGNGPNTGGVGAYAPLPFLKETDLESIHQIIHRTAEGLKKEGIDYRGVLYFGLMLTPSGPQVLEFNCRFGDPETQAILPLIQSDLADRMIACARGCMPTEEIKWSNRSSCCVVLFSEGYPGEYRTGFSIEGLETKDQDNISIYHAGTQRDSHGRVVTAGGRVLGVTATGKTIEEAVQDAYKAAEKIYFEGVRYRKDIAWEAMVLQRN